ncbi:MAG: hypothetical protein KF810_12445, partial [Rhizobiaceae bacterium]|nr:hypothetical protein [Rhizobiaceae bacterium]
YAEYPCEFPRPLWVEQDAELLFEACCKVLEECIGRSGLGPEDIGALSFSTQRCTLIPVDKDCHPLRRAISWQDNRSDAQCDFIRDVIGEEEFYAISGLPIANVWALPSILWIRDNEPDIYERTHKFMHPHGFLLRRFGSDDFVEDWSNASLHGLMSITDFAWSPKFLEATEIPRRNYHDWFHLVRWWGGSRKPSRQEQVWRSEHCWSQVGATNNVQRSAQA